jgi:hypothetical protein
MPFGSPFSWVKTIAYLDSAYIVLSKLGSDGFLRLASGSQASGRNVSEQAFTLVAVNADDDIHNIGELHPEKWRLRVVFLGNVYEPAFRHPIAVERDDRKRADFTDIHSNILQQLYITNAAGNLNYVVLFDARTLIDESLRELFKVGWRCFLSSGWRRRRARTARSCVCVLLRHLTGQQQERSSADY